MKKIVLLLAMILLLSGCGHRGALYLPPDKINHQSIVTLDTQDTTDTNETGF